MPTSDEVETLPANEARERFADLVSRAQHGKVRFIIQRHRKPAAALVSIEDLALLEAFEDQRDVEEARAAIAEWHRTGRKSTALENVVQELGLGELGT